MNLRRKIATVAITLFGVGGVVAVTAPSAMASSNGYVHAFSPVYKGPSSGTALLYVTQYDAWIPMDCYTDTQDAGVWHRWFHFYGQQAYVRSDYVSPQPSVPHC